MTHCCNVCGKRLPRSGNTDNLCRKHQFEEGNVWVLEYDFNADFYIWRPKFPTKTGENGIKPRRSSET